MRSIYSSPVRTKNGIKRNVDPKLHPPNQFTIRMYVVFKNNEYRVNMHRSLRSLDVVLNRVLRSNQVNVGECGFILKNLNLFNTSGPLVDWSLYNTKFSFSETGYFMYSFFNNGTEYTLNSALEGQYQFKINKKIIDFFQLEPCTDLNTHELLEKLMKESGSLSKNLSGNNVLCLKFDADKFACLSVPSGYVDWASAISSQLPAGTKLCNSEGEFTKILTVP
jgi:hypothetical protein